MRCFGHVQRRGSEYIGRRMLMMELPDRRKGGDVVDVVKSYADSWVERRGCRGHGKMGDMNC